MLCCAVYGKSLRRVRVHRPSPLARGYSSSTTVAQSSSSAYRVDPKHTNNNVCVCVSSDAFLEREASEERGVAGC